MGKQRQNPATTRPEDEELEDFEVEEENPDEAIDEELEAYIEDVVNQAISGAMKSVSDRFESLEKHVGDHDHRLMNLEKLVDNLRVGTPVIHEQVKPMDRVLDMTLGTAGRAAHAALDAVAFVGESIIDIATLGRAKVNRK